MRGLAEICFTTHYDVNPRGLVGDTMMRVDGVSRPADDAALARYVDDVRKAHDQFFPRGLTVVLGIEFGWYRDCEEEAARIRRKFGFDYMLAGVHDIADICFCCTGRYETCFSRYSLENMVELYYRDVISAARSGLFNTIAHLDYYKKYGEKFYGPAIHEAHRPFLADVFSALIESGTAIEVNTAARRRGFDSYYPRNEIINAARRAGVDIAHIGSDAHAPDQVGYDFDLAYVFAPNTAGGGDDD